MLNSIDQALQTAVPVYMVPMHEPFQMMADNGHRFLAARDGLWLEVKRPWMHLIWPLVKQSTVLMPYGEVERVMDFKKVPKELIDQFVETAKSSFPNECASWIVWNETEHTWRIINMVPDYVDTDNVDYHYPRLELDEHLVLDLHSHAAHPAFFSEKDDQDDQRGVRLAGVIGNVNNQLTTKFRLCTLGMFIELDTSPIEGNSHGFA